MIKHLPILLITQMLGFGCTEESKKTTDKPLKTSNENSKSIVNDDAIQYITLLGTVYSADKIQAIKKKFNAKRPEMDYEDATANWSFYEKSGLEFTFADEAIFTDNEADDIGVGKLFLTDVQFYASSECCKFHDKHSLPFGVNYGDSLESVEKRMKSEGAEEKDGVENNSSGEKLWALTRKDGKRYVVTFTFDKTGVIEAKIHLYYGQDYLDWVKK